MEKADYMFQYVRFQFEALQNLNTVPKIRKDLRELPIGLDATYNRILHSIDTDFQCQLLGSLKRLAFSKMTLSIEGLSEAFRLYTMNSNDGTFDEAERPFSCTDILKYFSGLIVTHDGNFWSGYSTNTVRLVHFLKEYLTSSRVLEGSASVFSLNEVDSHLSIVRACFVYLWHISSQYAKGVDLKSSDHSYHLANYVGNYLLVHLEEILHESAEIGQEALPLLASNSQTLVTLLRIGRDFPPGSELNLRLRPYCYAALLGFRRLTERLISDGINKYITQEDLGRALSTAIYQGNTDVMQLFLKAGADVNVYGRQGTSLRNAMRRGDLTASDLLETHGTIVGGHPIIECISKYYQDEKAVKLLLDGGVDINMQDWRNETAIHVVISRGDERIFKLLLERGADITQDYTTGFIKVLLDKGADPNIRGGRFGTARQAACAILSTNGNPERPGFRRDLRYDRHSYNTTVISRNIRLLIDHGADMNIQGGEYGTALHALTGSREPETGQLMKLLLNSGAKVNQLSDWGTALHVACHEGMIETVHLLLDHDADVNAVGGKFGTPLQAAVTSMGWRWGTEDAPAREQKFILEIVELLLGRGAEMNQKGGKYGTALQAAYAIEYIDMELICLLLNHEADITAEGGHHKTMLAAACSNPVISYQSVKMLLDYGAGPNARGVADGTALIFACERQYFRLMQVLVDHGADGAAVNAKDEERLELVTLLLKEGADVNVEDRDGQTPLTIACKYDGGAEIVKLLLEHGANVFHQDCAAWHEAAQRSWAAGPGDILAIPKLLYNYHIDVNHVHKEHGTVLNTLVGQWYYDSGEELYSSIRWLLDHGANINILGGEFGFPLQAACTITGMSRDGSNVIKIQRFYHAATSHDVKAA
ncbi:ankyrin repeat-containing domain protein [Trichoderma compactum]